MTCQARREGDEYFCGRCRLRWGVDDLAPPGCQGTQAGAATVAELRDQMEAAAEDVKLHNGNVICTAFQQTTALNMALWKESTVHDWAFGISLFVQDFIRTAGPKKEVAERLEAMIAAIRCGFD